MITKQCGFTLIELMVFMIGTSILVSSLMLAFQMTMAAAPAEHYDSIATEIAAGCMEAFVTQRRLSTIGYSSTYLACSTAPPYTCITQTGFTVASTITCSPTLSGDSTTSRTVTVNVTGLGTATLSMLLANY